MSADQIKRITQVVNASDVYLKEYKEIAEVLLNAMAIPILANAEEIFTLWDKLRELKQEELKRIEKEMQPEPPTID